MAIEGPDPKTFSSWEEAFEQPVPAVRGMEKQLRRDIESNKEKLRTLVGASYRDLLNTAESIIEMNDQMHNVETHMAEIGQKCNTRILERKSNNFRVWHEEVNGPDSARYAFASQLSVLRSCPDVISRLLKSGGPVLLASKVLVISRLLHTKLSKRANPPPYLETLRNRLASLRRRLLARIDRRFKGLDASQDALVEAMCAFALATSSSQTDVVRHFHHLRLEAMIECMGKDSEGQDSLLKALRLYVKTLRVSKALVPGQLAHALERLKLVSIFKSEDLYNLPELNFDLHERWIGDDIKTFTPYVRHDDLSRGEAERLLKQWARTAVSRFLDGLRARIRDVRHPVRLMQLRKEVLGLWLRQHQHSLGIDSAQTLDGMRDVFNDQAINIIQKRVSLLERLGSSVQGTIKDWRQGESDLNFSLWDPSVTSMNVANGGKRLCEAVTDRLHGKNDPLRGISTEYTQWLESISAIEDTIKLLRETKWEDVVDDVDDDELLDNRQVLLSEDDPRLLQEELVSAITKAYIRLETSLEPANLLGDQKTSGPRAVFVLRVWRELRQRLPGSYRSKSLGFDHVPKLASTVVSFVLKAPLRSCGERLLRATKGRGLTARSLWEGLPELPVLPSPWVYRLLLETVQVMTEMGPDIWSFYLSNELKRNLARQIADLLQNQTGSADTSKEVPTAKIKRHVNGKVDGEKADAAEEKSGDDEESGDTPAEIVENGSTAENVNGTYLNGDSHSEPGDNESGGNERKIQRLFDVLYLMHASSTSSSGEKSGEGLIEIQAALEDELELEMKSLERLRKDAGEYWKRTKLLFALL